MERHLVLALLITTTLLLDSARCAMKQKTFARISNRRMNGDHIRTEVSTSSIDCGRRCLLADGCLAANYHPTTKSCEMRSESPDKYGADTEWHQSYVLYYVPGPCGTSEIYYGTSCYYAFETQRTTLDDATALCSARGARLVEIDDHLENSFIFEIGQNAAGMGIWIGLNDRASEGTHVWPSGAPVNFINFGSGEGFWLHEDCVFFSMYTGQWCDAMCDRIESVICEKPI